MQTYTLTVARAEPAASISGDITGTVTEDDAIAFVNGNLNIDNPGSIGSDFVPVLVGRTDYGAYLVTGTGDWQFDLDNSFPATNALVAGETVIETFTVTAQGDATLTQDITITINGANDAPTAEAGDDQTVLSGVTVTLDGSASADPDIDGNTPDDAIDSYA